ncbi:MAG: flagellar hook-basal body complex protein [Deltaproteobacteria bacterium]|nr:flagellar hook-basal body complex protein [Deltaproteobacteria bacterium]
MSISAALYTGITGLSTMGMAMSVIGNNIANVNTIGFKQGRVQFMDILSQNVSSFSGGSQVGKGVGLGTIDNVFSQGAFTNSDENTHVAISGEGFFTVRDPDKEAFFYTRAGNFTLDNEGRLVTPLSHVVQGWALDDNQMRTGTPTDILLTTSNLPAVPTSRTSIISNLQADLSSRSTSLWGAWDGTADTPINGDSYAYQSSIQMYDSLGQSHTISVYYDPNYNPIQSSLTTTLAGVDNDITYTAVTGGTNSNNITITYVDPGAARATTDVTSVTASAITVTLAHSGAAITATANDVLAAIAASTNASNLVTAAAAGTGLGTVTAMAATNLIGGSDVNTTPNQWEYIVGMNPDDDFRLINGKSVIGTQQAGLLMRGILQFDPNSGAIATTPASITSEIMTDIDIVNSPPNAPTWASQTPNTIGYFTFSTNTVAGSNDQVIEMNLGARNQGGIGNWTPDSLSTTQFASTSTTIYQTQDGYSSSFLESIQVRNDGVISGTYTNGQSVGRYQLTLALFQNQWDLDKLGENLYGETDKSGAATPVPASTGGAGDIHPNTLEQSNVDLAQEFVDMIVIQRGFQANSKIITTTDAMLADLIQLKR